MLYFLNLQVWNKLPSRGVDCDAAMQPSSKTIADDRQMLHASARCRNTPRYSKPIQGYPTSVLSIHFPPIDPPRTLGFRRDLPGMGFPEVWGRQGLAPGTEWDVSATVTEWQLQTWNMSAVCIWLRPCQLSRQTLERYLVNLSHVFTEERRMFYPFVAFCFIICHQNKQHKELRTTMIQPFFFPSVCFSAEVWRSEARCPGCIASG